MAEKHEQLPRVGVEALDGILGLPFQVLDDGFVRVIDYMGTDASIVQAARISYGRGTKQVHEDRGLIRYLMRHGHTTPFEMCEIKLHVRVPMDCWRQWIRHRTASVNEYSTRYSDVIDAAQRTKPDQWRRQSMDCKQGSGEPIGIETGTTLSDEEELLQSHARQVYQKRIQLGVAREQARKDMPLSTYTEAYWKIDLHNLLHFLSLRMDEHAQIDIRSYASVIGNEIVSKWCPIAWEAFVDYRLRSQSLSRLEMDMLHEIHLGRADEAIRLATQFGWLETSPSGLKRHREREEFQAKLADMGLSAPWPISSNHETSEQIEPCD
jgi:thymidylate synthase (FAD)